MEEEETEVAECEEALLRRELIPSLRGLNRLVAGGTGSGRILG